MYNAIYASAPELQIVLFVFYLLQRRFGSVFQINLFI